MKILILNWSDIANPDAGGAELLTHEIAKRWVHAGHTVTQFSSEFSGAKQIERIDGITIIRRGSSMIRDPHVPVHLSAYFWYMRQGQGAYDVVLDEIHGIPFFTPLYVKVKKIALICEVANELWDATFPFPFNMVGKTIEHHYFRLYKNVPFLTISASSKDDLIQKGVPADHITILPMGLTVPEAMPRYAKEKTPTLLFVGRLAKTKGIDVLLRAFQGIRYTLPDAKLWIIGRGDEEYKRELLKTIARLHLENTVRFFGRVEERKKFELMARAHILLVPSIKEGWGLIVPESGYVGTPAVAYDVPGLHDVIIHNKSGMLVAPNQTALHKGALLLFRDKRMYDRLQKGARTAAKKYSWDKTAEVALAKLQGI